MFKAIITWGRVNLKTIIMVARTLVLYVKGAIASHDMCGELENMRRVSSAHRAQAMRSRAYHEHGG